MAAQRAGGPAHGQGSLQGSPIIYDSGCQSRKGREVLGEGRPLTRSVAIAEATDAQDEANRAAAPGQISGMAVVAIVELLREDASARTGSGARCRFCFHEDGSAVEHDAVNGEG